MAEEKKYRNLKRDAGEVCQIYAQIPTEVNDKITEIAAKRGITRAGFVSYILTKAVENGGDISTPPPVDLSKIDDKLDTIINLIVKKL